MSFLLPWSGNLLRNSEFISRTPVNATPLSGKVPGDIFFFFRLEERRPWGRARNPWIYCLSGISLKFVTLIADREWAHFIDSRLMMKNANRCENLFSVVMFISTISSFPDNIIDNTIENETGNFTNFKRNIHESHFQWWRNQTNVFGKSPSQTKLPAKNTSCSFVL